MIRFMENIQDVKDEIFRQFSSQEALIYDVDAIIYLKKKINKYLSTIGKADLQLVNLLKILEVFRVDIEFTGLDYDSKMKENYKMMESTIEYFKYLKINMWEVNDLRISQVAVTFSSNIEEAIWLYDVSMKALKKLIRDRPTDPIEVYFHNNMMRRALEAIFFEIDHENEKELFKKATDAFEYHYNEILKICQKDKTDVLKVHEVRANLRAATLDKNSEEVVKQLKRFKKVTKRENYELMKKEISQYSFHEDFEHTEEHFAIVVGYNIRRLRKKMGLSPEDFAEKIVFSDSYIGQIERGTTNLPGNKLFEIARFFDVTVEELCYGKVSTLAK